MGQVECGEMLAKRECSLCPLGPVAALSFSLLLLLLPTVDRLPSTVAWLDNHPGGSEVVLLMAGRDATDAFASYHPFTDKPRKVRKPWQCVCAGCNAVVLPQQDGAVLFLSFLRVCVCFVFTDLG